MSGQLFRQNRIFGDGIPRKCVRSSPFFLEVNQQQMKQSDVSAFHQQKLQELADKPNTTVFTVNHDQVSTAWQAKRVSNVLESIAGRLQIEFQDNDKFSDFYVRKKCLEDGEVLQFQRQHPKLYWMVTDREKMKDVKYRAAVSALLEVRRRVESGDVKDGEEADAAATRTVIDALK